jgi:hypothetical protein
MSEMLGISGVSAGNAPKRVGSGRAISLLQSAGEARINPLQVNLEEGLAKFGKLCLQIIEKTYDLPRLISVVGNNRSREIKDFKGQMLKGNDNVTVELRSALPLNKQSAIDVVNTWTMNGIIPRGGDGQPTKEGRKMAVQMLNLESFNPLNASALLEEQAKWENALLDNMAKESMATEEQVPAMQVDPMTGAQIPTGGMQTIVNGMPRHPWDNDEVHIQVHRERHMEISYLKLIEENPEIEKNYEAHIAEHEEALVAKMNIPQPGQAPVLPQDTPMPNEQMPPMQMPGGDMPMEIPGMEDMQIPPELM